MMGGLPTIDELCKVTKGESGALYNWEDCHQVPKEFVKPTSFAFGNSTYKAKTLRYLSYMEPHICIAHENDAGKAEALFFFSDRDALNKWVIDMRLDETRDESVSDIYVCTTWSTDLPYADVEKVAIHEFDNIKEDNSMEQLCWTMIQVITNYEMMKSSENFTPHISGVHI